MDCGNGLLIEPENPVGFAEALRVISSIRNKVSRPGIAAAKSGANRLDNRTIMPERRRCRNRENAAATDTKRPPFSYVPAPLGTSHIARAPLQVANAFRPILSDVVLVTGAGLRFRLASGMVTPLAAEYANRRRDGGFLHFNIGSGNLSTFTSAASRLDMLIPAPIAGKMISSPLGGFPMAGMLECCRRTRRGVEPRLPT